MPRGVCGRRPLQRDVWYVGGLTGHEGRTVTLDLGFLGDGNFTAEIFCDGTNAAKYGHDYQRVTRTLGMDRTLEITIAPAGDSPCGSHGSKINTLFYPFYDKF